MVIISKVLKPKGVFNNVKQFAKDFENYIPCECMICKQYLLSK